MAGEIFDYFAFISYSHTDKETAQKLQKRLERYHMPAKLLQAHPELPKKLSPIFRDESDISGKGTLIETLHDNLRRSQYLILICSPSSAKSEYVNDEVDYFINELHREDKIIPLIVGGIPRSKDESIECFPPAILALDREREPLGIDLKTFGRDGAFLRVVAAMLRLNFTYFKSREDEERKRRLKIFASVVAVLAVIVGVIVWYNFDLINQALYSPLSQFERGDIYHKKGDYANAIKLYEKAAAQGNVYALNNLGTMYKNGKGVKQDYVKAVKFFEEAAAKGYAPSQNNLGNMYRDGLGVEKDYAKAVELYGKAAAQGDPSAQNNLGIMYANGWGVKQDYLKAKEFYEKAAVQNNAHAQCNLGMMYLHGLGVPQSSDKAIEYFTQAAQQGHEGAKSELQKLSQQDK